MPAKGKAKATTRRRHLTTLAAAERQTAREQASAKRATTKRAAPPKADSSPRNNGSQKSTSRTSKARNQRKAGFEHVAGGWLPADIARQFNEAIAAAMKAANRPAAKPAPRKRVTPNSSPARQVDAGALPSTPRGRARAAQIAASFA